MELRRKWDKNLSKSCKMIEKKTIKKFYNMFVSFNHEKIIKHIASENIDNNMMYRVYMKILT